MESKAMNEMKTTSYGFTLIEILAVLVVICILAAMLIPNLARVKEKSVRTICVHNVKNLTQALCLYTSLTEGFLQKADKGSNANQIYGALFQKNGWSDLQNLVCPSHAAAVPPVAAGYGNPLNRDGAGAVIDYWVVFAGNTSNRLDNGTSSTEINTISAPGENVLIIECFSVDGTWSQADFHHEGGTVGHVNGRAEFVTQFPVNEKENGSTAAITKAECSS
jgi:prepilin-type N-terminal cleavage/methylation domain-containing protein